MKQMKQILEGVYTNSELRKSIVPLFLGDPGLGKTKIIEGFAKEKGVNLVELITSQMSPFEISGIAMPDKELQKMIYYNFDKLESLKDGDILFFDELLNGNPIVLNACLTILEQRRMISGKDLPDILIIAAANPQGMTPITPQIKERFVWYEVKFEEPMWIKYMMDKYQITKTIGAKLAALIKGETFSGKNFYTPRSVDKAVNMLIHNVPTPYQTSILTILSESIKNPFEQEIDLGNGETLMPNEMISWIKLIQLKNKIFTNKPLIEECSYILPKNWFITVTRDNFEEIYEYYKPMEVSWGKTVGYVLSDRNNSNYWKTNKELIPKNYEEITIEQFRKYVLNKL